MFYYKAATHPASDWSAGSAHGIMELPVDN